MMMTAAERTRWLRKQADAAGFDLCGVAPVGAKDRGFEDLQHLPEWLARGYAGEMQYLHDARRADPRLVLEGARSLIVVALNYNSSHPYSTQLPADPGDEPPRGWISRYAWGEDYHDVLGEKLKNLVAAMRAQFSEPFEARSYVDTGPIVERVAAKYAGLGWLAKNTCLINQNLGSWLFLGVIITTLELDPTLAPGAPPAPDLCGSCTRCLDACPTNAFVAPYVLDARRCISYLTIEFRGSIPDGLRPAMGQAVIGCDICQDVCPWNRKAPATSLAAFQPRENIAAPESKSEGPEPQGGTGKLRVSNSGPLPAGDNFHSSLFAPGLEWLAALSQQDFSAAFRRSAVKRAKWRGTIRNACVAIGNSTIAPGSPLHKRVLALLERLASSEDALIGEHARWALARLSIPAEDSPGPR